MNKKQEIFCREYLIDFNATQAAIRAGYSKKSAYSIGHENLKKPEIKKEIEVLSIEAFSILGLTQNRIIHELAALAFSPDIPPQVRIKSLEMLLDRTSKKGSNSDIFKEHANRVLENLKRLGNLA